MIDYEALEAAGLCDCTVPLDTHPPLPRRKAPQSWHAARGVNPEFARNRAANSQQVMTHERFRRLRGDGRVVE